MSDLPRQNDLDDKEEESQLVHTSILFEKYSIWVLLAGLLIAIWYRFVPLIVVSIFLMLLSIMIIVWKRKSLTLIEPTIELSKSRLFANNDFHIHASVYNDKWLPLPWLEWEFPKNKGVVFGKHEKHTYLTRFLWLLWFQRVQWTINGKAGKRGVYNIGWIKLRSGDGFRFSEIEQEYHLNGKIYVYPKLVPVSVPPFRVSMQWGVNGKQGGVLEDPLLINGIREYQDGDEVRRFNWRASARTGKLQTNIYQPVVIEQLTIYIDVQGFVINKTAFEDPIKLTEYISKKEEEFEWILSVITSVAVTYKEQGISIGFISNGLNNLGKKMSMTPPSTNLTPVLDQLAEMTQSVSSRNMISLDELLIERKLSTPLFIFCEKITESHYMWYEINKQKLTEVRFYYMYETDYSKKLITAKQLDTFISFSNRTAGEL